MHLERGVSMTSYIIRRLLILIPVILGLTLVVFLLVNVLPGDTARLIAGEYADEATVENIRVQMGLDQPILVQYGRYLGDLLKGDLGRSYQTHRPIANEIRAVFPKTIQLAITTEIIGLVIGVLLGMAAALRHGKALDRFISMFGVLGLSMPQFWFALVLQLLLSVKLGLLPPSGYKLGFDLYIILPSLTLGIPTAGWMSRVARSAFLEVLPQNFIRAGYAKGLSRNTMVWKHTLKNTMIPVISLVGTDMSRLLTGTMIVESVFVWPGIGKYGLDALLMKDMPALQATVIVLALSICLVNLIVDVLYAVVDPRIRYK